MSEQKDCCQDCIFWKREQVMAGPSLVMLADVYGYCQRYPPQCHNDKFGIFPVTMESMWCGEFKKQI